MGSGPLDVTDGKTGTPVKKETKRATQTQKIPNYMFTRNKDHDNSQMELLTCGQKAKQNPHMTAKHLPEGLADTGVAVHCSTVHCLHKHDLHGKVIRSKPYLQKSTSAVCETTSRSARGILETSAVD